MATRSITALRFNRIVELQERHVTRDDFGSELESWREIANVWADKRQTKGSEKFSTGSNKVLVTRKATFQIHFMPGLNELMRLVDEERVVWGIVGIGVVRFNRAHDLICESDGTRLPLPVESPEEKAPAPADPKLGPEKPVR